jgi:hypothetical protein
MVLGDSQNAPLSLSPEGKITTLLAQRRGPVKKKKLQENKRSRDWLPRVDLS